MTYDVVIIGGGPAGLAAALEVCKRQLRIALVERENRLGGILKQCIHDGFGLITFHEKLTGPEYAYRFIERLKKENIDIKLLTYVTDIKRCNQDFMMTIVDKEGIHELTTHNIIFATGCKERSRNQILIPGDRGVGIYTAGVTQNLVNILGISPCKKPVILGSGDIGLIMARRLTLEGSKVIGVYEIKPTPAGLTRNIVQCLNDYHIPLYLSHTITKIIGKDRVEAVEISKVDQSLKPIKGTETIVECDAIILAVGLIPENEIQEKLKVPMDSHTKGPIVDQNMMTLIPGVYACGNCLHVNDLVDFVTESAQRAGKAIKLTYQDRKLIKIDFDEKILYLVPQKIDLNSLTKTVVYFRFNDEYHNVKLIVKIDNKEIYQKKYPHLLPPEMERIELDLSSYPLNLQSVIMFDIKEDEK